MGDPIIVTGKKTIKDLVKERPDAISELGPGEYIIHTYIDVKPGGDLTIGYITWWGRLRLWFRFGYYGWKRRLYKWLNNF